MLISPPPPHQEQSLGFPISQPPISQSRMAQQRQQLDESFDLPPGFIFAPTDELLVGYYLRRRVHDNSKSPMIKEFDIYTTEPWNLPRDFFGYQGEESDIYFFTPRHPTSRNSTRADRTAGKGFWDGNGRDKLIEVGDVIVGHKTALNFKIVREGEKIKTDWVMHEFRLFESEKKFDDFVLCRIHRKKGSSSSSSYKRPREEAAIEGGVLVVGAGDGEGSGEAGERQAKRIIQVEEEERAATATASSQEHLPPLVSTSDERCCQQEHIPPLVSASQESCNVVPSSTPSIPVQDCSHGDDFDDVFFLDDFGSMGWIDEYLRDVDGNDER